MSETPQQPPQPWRSEIMPIIRHRQGREVLLVNDKLPLFRFDPIVDASMAGSLAAELRAALDCPAILLGSVWGEYNGEARMLRAAPVFVVSDPAWAPPAGARWAADVDPAMLRWPDTALHQAVATLLALPADAGVPLRAPWARPGFFERAGAWIAEQLADTPWQLNGPVQQFRAWGISCVLLAPTAGGNVYFKAAGGSELFADEPAVVQALARQYPDLVPEPLAREPEQRWMLLPELGEQLRESKRADDYTDAIKAFGAMQVALAGRVEPLLAAGLRDRRLRVLQGQLQPLLTDPLVQSILGAGVHDRLVAAAPKLLSVCERLAEYNIPPSVIHGDLHSGNIALRDGSFRVFDWTDAALAHPFFDLLTYGVPASVAPEREAMRARLLDDYLSLWQHYEPPARLREAWRLAQVAGCLHHLVSYQHIMHGVEALSRWELQDGVTGFADELLQELDRLGADMSSS